MRDDWETPPELFSSLDAEFRFTVDACGYSTNAKLKRFWSEADDGLAQDWAGERVWCNPPYNATALAAWVNKAIKEQALTVMLLPSRTDTRWFSDVISHAVEIRFLTRRVPFLLDGRLAANSRPTWASLIAIFQSKRVGITPFIKTVDWRKREVRGKTP